VEEALCNQSCIRQAAMVGIPHAALGTQPTAFVTLHDGVAATSVHVDTLKQVLQADVGTDLSSLRIEIMKDLPMTPTGKIAKGELLQMVIQPQ
jgi:acyl-coenzyme A synthetase/AMP-(fatty) acid ligase